MDVMENNDDICSNFLQGMEYHKQKKYQEALSEYIKSINLDIREVEALTKIGLIKYEMEDESGAIQQWNKALKVNSEAVESKMAIGVALYALGDRNKGLEIAKEIIDTDQQWADLDYLKENLWGERLQLNWSLLILGKISRFED